MTDDYTLTHNLAVRPDWGLAMDAFGGLPDPVVEVAPGPVLPAKLCGGDGAKCYENECPYWSGSPCHPSTDEEWEYWSAMSERYGDWVPGCGEPVP